jgi:hypothetical protein
MDQYIAPSIKMIDGAIDFSEKLIEIAKSVPDDRWLKSALSGDSEYNSSIRVSNELNIDHGLGSPTEFYLVAKAIHLAARDYAMENGVEVSHMEGINLLEYLPNEGFFDRHSDAGPDFPRAMSTILYLNDVEEGGETWFDKFGISVQPKSGRMILFPSNYAYSHQAMPPISGNKYVLVTWFGMKLSSNVFERYYR